MNSDTLCTNNAFLSRKKPLLMSVASVVVYQSVLFRGCELIATCRNHLK